jgi:chromosome segregation ATPase
MGDSRAEMEANPKESQRSALDFLQRPKSQARPVSSRDNLGYYQPRSVSSHDLSSSLSSTVSISEVEFQLNDALRANAAFEDRCNELQDENRDLKERLLASERYCKTMDSQLSSLSSERDMLAKKLKGVSDCRTSDSSRQLECVLSHLMTQMDRLKVHVREHRDIVKVEELCKLVSDLELYPTLDYSKTVTDPHVVQLNTLTNEINRLKNDLEKSAREAADFREKALPPEAYQNVVDQLRNSILSPSEQSSDSISPHKYQKLKERSKADNEKLRSLSTKYNQLVKRKSELKQETQRLNDELHEYKALQDENRALQDELESLRLNYASQSARVGELEKKTKYLSLIKGHNKENINSNCSSDSFQQSYYPSPRDLKKFYTNSECTASDDPAKSPLARSDSLNSHCDKLTNTND